MTGTRWFRLRRRWCSRRCGGRWRSRLAVAEAFGERTALADLKRANLAGDLPPARKSEFSALLTAEALVTAHVFGNALAYLMSSHLGEATAEVGEVEEVLTDNGQLALHGALWELDQVLANHAPDDVHLVAATSAFAEQVDGEGGAAGAIGGASGTV